MDTLIGGWVGRTVVVTLKVGGIAGAVKVKGRLAKAGDAGIVLDTGKGQTFVPTGAILHVSVTTPG